MGINNVGAPRRSRVLVRFRSSRYSKIRSFIGTLSFENYCVLPILNLIGGVGERLKPPVLKTGVHFVDREFESRPLRHLSAESGVLRTEGGMHATFVFKVNAAW